MFNPGDLVTVKVAYRVRGIANPGGWDYKQLAGKVTWCGKNTVWVKLDIHGWHDLVVRVPVDRVQLIPPPESD